MSSVIARKHPEILALVEDYALNNFTFNVRRLYKNQGFSGLDFYSVCADAVAYKNKPRSIPRIGLPAYIMIVALISVFYHLQPKKVMRTSAN